MPTSYTNLLGFALPVTGELSGTWGDVVNNSITELVEDSIAGSATASVASGDWTLTTTGSGATNQARCAILIPTGSPGVTRNIIAPASSKAYIVDNQSNAAVVVKASATTGVSIASNTAALVAWDGADFVLVSQDLANATGTLPVSKGGTGATTLTGVLKGNGTSAVTASNVNLTSEVTGTLPVANGGTGITSFGTGVATALGQNVTGSGGIALATSPVFTTPNLGTPSAATLTNATGLPIVGGTTGTLSVARGGTGATTLTGLVLGNGTSAFTTVTAPSGTVVGTTDTQTLSAKRVNPRVVAAGATSGNLTINGDTTDLYKAEGLTGAITLLTPSGTPVDGQKLMIRLEDNGTARGITWTTSAGAFREVGITLPLTTTASKVTYVGCVYNSTDGFWDAVATVTQA